ncbi:hypothetical protein M9458_048913, partial [Cirrhinus mrigala]
MSSIPTSFSAVQSSSPELSDELTTALAAGRWWAIMEVSSPLSEEPEYGDLTSLQWWGTMEAGETSCPTSLVFSDESEKAESLHSDFLDETLKTKEPLHPCLPGPKREHLDHASSLVFSEAFEKAECNSEDQGAPEEGPLVPARTGSQQRGKLRIPDYLKRHLLKATSELGAPVSARFPQVEPVPTVSPQDTPMGTKSLQRESVPASNMPKPKVPEQLRQQQKPQASSVQGVAVPNKTRERQRPKIAELLRQELLQVTPPDSSVKGAPAPSKTPEMQRLKIPEPLKQELLQLSAQASCQKTPERHKIPERLQQKPQASPVQGAPMPSKASQEAPLPNRDPVQAETPQGAGVPARSPPAEAVPMPAEPLKGAAVLSKTIMTRKRKLAERQGMPVSATQGSPLPSKTSKVVPVYSGTLHVTKSSPQQGTNPRITEQQRQQQREQKAS